MISAKETYVRIDEWMTAVERDADWDRELHIDNVHESVASRRSWIAAAAKFFEVASDVRDRRAHPLFVEVSFDLGLGDEPIGTSISSVRELRAMVTAVPPALYCYPAAVARDVLDGGVRCSVPGLDIARSRTLVIERFREIEGDYERRLVVVSPPKRA